MPRPSDAHLTEEEFGRLLTGVSSDDLQAHLAACFSCSEELAMQRAAEESICSLSGLRVPPSSRCPPQEIWRNIAQGTEVPILMLEHAAECEGCGLYLHAALESQVNPLSAPESAPTTRFASEESRAKLAELMARKWKDGAQPAADPQLLKRSPSPFGWRFAAIAALMVFAVLGIALWIHQPSTDDLIARGFRDKPTVDFRIPGTEYAPMRVERSGPAANFNRSASLLEAGARVARGLSHQPDSPILLEEKARIDLLNWDYQSALLSLTRAVAIQPDNRQARLDMALAYFERGEAENRPVDFGTTIELLSHILEMDPKDTVALFNRALAEERSRMYREALADWDEYLELDSRGGWADQAREHRSAVRKLQARAGRACTELTAEMVAAWSDSSNEIKNWEGEWECLRDQAISQWLGHAVGSGGGVFSKALIISAAAFRESLGDTWLDSLLQSTESPSFAEAARALSDASRANLTLDSGAAAATRAEELFREIGNEAGIAQSVRERAYAVRRLQKGLECRAVVRGFPSGLGARSWPWISAQARLETASCLAMLGDFAAARREARAAFLETTRPALSSLHLRALSYLESYAYFAGDYATAWQLGEEGLGTYWTGNFEHVWAYQLYFNLGAAATAQKRYRLASELQRETLAEIQLAHRPLLEAFTWSDYGRTSLAAGALNQARDALLAASAKFQALPVTAARDTAVAETEIYLAQVDNLLGRPSDGLARLERIAPQMQLNTAVSGWLLYDRTFAQTDELLSRRTDYEKRIRALAGLSLGFASPGDFADQLRRRRENSDIARRVTAFVALDQNDPRRALDLWEWFRAAPLRKRSEPIVDRGRFRDVIAGPPFDRAPNVIEMLTRLRIPQALIYVVLKDQLLIWSTQGERITMRSIPVKAEVLERLAGELYLLCADPESSEQSVATSANKLAVYLIRPIEHELNLEVPLWVELDDSIMNVPIQILPLASGDLLAEKCPVAVFPGAGYLKPVDHGDAALSSGPALVVGVGKGIPPLPTAIEEAREVAGEFAKSRLLLNEEGTRNVIKRELAGAVVFHFSGHTLNTADRAALALGASGGGEGDEVMATLDADDIATMDLSRCRLAILSTCAADAPDLFDESRSTGFALALLRAGASSVLTTRWNLDSVVARQYIKEFYAQLRRGQSALRAAQGAAMKIRHSGRTRHPYYWASYQFVGSA